MISQLLTEIDGMQSLNNVIIIAATNRPDILDPALLRPGRFDRLVHVGMPDLEARRMILQIHTAKKPLADDVDLDRLAEKTEGFTGADLTALTNEAVMLAIRSAVAKNGENSEVMKSQKITMAFFEMALEKVKPVSRSELGIYEKAAEDYVYVR